VEAGLLKMNPTSINDIDDVAPDGRSFLVDTRFTFVPRGGS
jgi:hypothetical protein